MTKREFIALAEIEGVEVEINRDPVWRDYDIGAWAPSKKRFIDTDTHFISLGTYSLLGEVNWKSISEQIGIQDCDPETCECECWEEALSTEAKGGY